MKYCCQVNAQILFYIKCFWENGLDYKKILVFILFCPTVSELTVFDRLKPF